MKININGFSYNIVEVEKTSLEDTIGVCNYEGQVIEIKKGLSKQQTKQTLIHELTHAFLWCYGFNEWALNEEAMCNFVGAYAQSIIDIANKYIDSKAKKVA